MSYEEQSLDLRVFLEQHALGPAVVIGHSMGGKAAMHFALTNPDWVVALVVVDIAPVSYPLEDEPSNTHRHLIETMLQLDVSRFTERRTVDAALAPAIADAGLRAFLTHNLVRSGKGFRWRLNLPVLGESLNTLRAFPDVHPAVFRGPTLFVRGGASDYVSSAHHPEMAGFFPGHEVISVESAGHWVHAERPTDVASAINAFVRLAGAG